MVKTFLLMLGGPGAGKGTQCERIEKYLTNCVHISTGDLLRAEIKNQTEIGKKVEEVIKKGELVSDSIICEMVNEFIKNSKADTILFDGYPRALSQYHSLLEQAKGIRIVVINLEIPDNILVQRIVSRGKTSGRADDNETAAANRLKVYHSQHDEMINAVKSGEYFVVDSLGNIDEVFEEIKKILAWLYSIVIIHSLCLVIMIKY